MAAYRFGARKGTVPARLVGEQRQRSSRAGRPPDPGAASGGNRLLSGLPGSVLARLIPHLDPVPLDRKEVLFRAHEALT
jgi:hypothetical protein